MILTLSTSCLSVTERRLAGKERHKTVTGTNCSFWSFDSPPPHPPPTNEKQANTEQKKKEKKEKRKKRQSEMQRCRDTETHRYTERER